MKTHNFAGVQIETIYILSRVTRNEEASTVDERDEKSLPSNSKTNAWSDEGETHRRDPRKKQEEQSVPALGR